MGVSGVVVLETNTPVFLGAREDISVFLLLRR
jgi:hypothetical protein